MFERRLLVALCLAGMACHVRPSSESGEIAEPIRKTTYSEDKRKLVVEMEKRMNELTHDSQTRLDAIREELEKGLRDLEPPVRLGAVERTLSGYGAAATERFESAIDRMVDYAVGKTEAMVGKEARAGSPAVEGEIEREAWRMAQEVGGRAQGAGYGFRSGVAEVDERAMVTIELLKGYANVADLKAAGALRKGEAIACSEIFRKDYSPDDIAQLAPKLVPMVAPLDPGASTRVGRAYLYQSDVLDEHRLPDQENVALVLAFQNDRLPPTTQFDFVQCVRYRVVRGGLIVDDFGWQLDPTVPSGDGHLELKSDLVDPRYVASKPFFPGVNIDHSQFDRLRDFSLIFDYKSMIVERATGSVLGGLNWQLQWSVSMTRQVRFIDSVPPGFDPDAAAVLAEARDGAMRANRPDFALARREPSPSDRLSSRRDPGDPLSARPEREFASGKHGHIATPMGSDHLRVTADGREFLLAHRMKLLTDDARFMSYLDGQTGRYVLSIIDIAENSPLLDLNFRDGDAIVSVNGAPIQKFRDLYEFFATHPDEKHFEVGVLRAAAQRLLVFDIDTPEGATTPAADTLAPELQARFDAMMKEGLPPEQKP